MTRLSLGTLLVLLLAAPAAQGQEALYETVSPGPFLGPIADYSLNSKSIKYDLDPAEGSIEDYTGWYDVVYVDAHAFDGNATTWYSVALETEVNASANGVVVDLNDGVPIGDPNAANYIQLDHPDQGDWVSTYWDLYPSVSEYVEIGDEVEENEIIGQSSGYGDELGEHLTFGTYYMGEAGCPYYEGYWRSGLEFFRGIYQFQDAVLYDDNEAGASVAGYQTHDYAYCGTGHDREGYYRYWHPTDWGTVAQAVDRFGGVEHHEDYDEDGSWESVAGGSRAEHVLGLASRGATEDASATFIPRLTTETEYEVFATWGPAANAADVVYTIVHLDGTDHVTIDQNGGSLGTFEEPRVITASPYHDSEDNSRSPSYYLFQYSCADAPEMSGPEVIYQLELADSGTLTATITTEEDVAADVVVLDAVDDNTCRAWGDDTVQVDVDAGRIYLAVDTPTTGDPGLFDLVVEYTASPGGDSAGPASDAHQWISLGTYTFTAGKHPDISAITVEVPESLTGATSNPARVVADSVWLHNTERLYFAWGEGGEDSPIADAILMLKEHALLGIKNAASWPVLTEPFDDSAMMFRAKRGQRFMSDENYDGWYEIVAPGLTGEVGYLHEDCCFVHNRLPPTDIEEWNPPAPGDDDDTAVTDDDDDGCKCEVAGTTWAGAAPCLLLALAAVLRRRR